MKHCRSLFAVLIILSSLQMPQMAFANDKKDSKVPAKVSKSKCTASLAKDQVKLQWKAFKTTKKLGVPGSFKDIRFSISGVPESVGELIRSLSFEIDATTVDTGVPGRDETLKASFFNLLKADKKITGKVKSYDEKQNKAVLSLNLNGFEKDVAFAAKEEKGKLVFTGHINILDFSLISALSSLVEACKELHKGEDGVSKTWPDVELTVEATPTVSCK